MINLNGIFSSIRDFILSVKVKDKRKGNSIQTFTDKRFWPLDPRAEDVCIEDIAHALSNKCRFSGHTKEFYSVAQHSVIVSLACNPEDALWGLLHDASEAYLVDLPSPLKILPEFAWFKKVERKVEIAICKHFNLSIQQPESTHYADKVALVTEKRDVMPPASDWQMKYPHKPLDEKIICLQPAEAKKLFLDRYRELTSKPIYNEVVE